MFKKGDLVERTRDAILGSYIQTSGPPIKCYKGIGIVVSEEPYPRLYETSRTNLSPNTTYAITATSADNAARQAEIHDVKWGTIMTVDVYWSKLKQANREDVRNLVAVAGQREKK